MLAQLRAWLEANVAEVAALSGAVKVHVNQAAQGTLTDHVVLEGIDDDPNNTLAGVSGFNTAEIEIHCKAETPDAAEALAAAIEEDLEPYSGSMGSITCEAVILNDRRNWFEAAKPGRDVDRHIKTLEITLQYS